MPKVKIDVTADGAGFHRVMNGVQNRVAGLGSSIKTQLAAAFSAATIGMIARSILQFGDEIQTLANNLDISTDAAQRFAWAERNANIQATMLGKTINTLDKALGDAFGGDKKTSSILQRLGIDPKDFKSIDKVTALETILKKSSNRNVTESLLTDIGIKRSDAGKIMGAKDDILNKDIPMLKASQINQLDTLGDTITNLTTVLKVNLAEALLKHAQSMLLWMKNTTSTLSVWQDKTSKMSKDPDSKRPSIADKFWRTSLFTLQQSGLDVVNFLQAANPFESRRMIDARKDDYNRIQKSIGDAYYKGLYGKEAFNNAMSNNEHTPNAFDSLTAVIDASIKSIEKSVELDQNKLKTSNINRSLYGDKEKVAEYVSKGGSSDMLKMGGVLGLDNEYRLQAIQTRIADYSQQTAKNTAIIADRVSRSGWDYSVGRSGWDEVPTQ